METTDEQINFENFFNQNTNGFCILNLQGLILHSNPAFYQKLGFELEEIKHQSFLQLIHPQEATLIKKRFVQFIQNGQSSKNRFQHKENGTIHLEWNVSLQKEDQKLFVTTRQLDDKYQDLEERSRIYVNIIENNWDAIIFSDIGGKILFANDSATKMYCYDRNELIGKNIETFNTHEASEKAKEIVSSLKKFGGWSGEVIHRRKDQSSIYVHLTISMLFNNASHPIGLVSNSKDITEIKEVEQQLIIAKNKTEEANRKLSEEKDKVQKTHQNMQSSISYAKYIQDAMLPKESELKHHFPDSFILFRPRDIVSGDFYWFAFTEAKPVYTEYSDFEQKTKVLTGFDNEKVLLAAVDCTGHGVPGAFMSVMANAYLNEIVTAEGITEPHLILNRLHKRIRVALNQESTDNKDGMDISLVVIDREANKMCYAGAKNPLYLYQNDHFKVLPSTPRSIGGPAMTPIPFEYHIINISQPTTFYLFSDGYQDQFGEATERKFLKKHFREMIQEICTLPIQEQQAIFEARLAKWQGEESQTDDILVIGVHLTPLIENSNPSEV
ncbi:MAG TPA: hypothetical protein DCS93_35615 [Microscillaceae bacterium]|nr:hypothetical protein [Microscillaceae bacterium]